ncbi:MULTISPECIES: GNAT family N-acetyltransferase [unclassified Kitasatospora]|uniref:GNAT family N-acetyltransferase n=1 Tax=unclassified Kitasatospora TaxID=2633591 RepID=UPI000AE7E1FA|nr:MULTISPECIES: GNAT family N-acetyltransferase [unclassified Kitasatospora]
MTTQGEELAVGVPWSSLEALSELRDGELLLRRPEERDADTLLAGSRDPLVREFMQGVLPHPDRDSATRWITEVAPRLWQADRAAYFAVAPPDGPAIGWAELVDQRPEEGAAEVAVWLLPEFRKMRTAASALRLVCRFGFEELGLRRIDAYAAAENMPVQVVGASIGFRRAGFRPALFRSSRTQELHDAVYATLVPEDLC